MDVKHRLKRYAQQENISISDFEKSIDVSNGYVNSISKSIGIDKLSRIIEIYSNLNIEWLLTGKGSMLRDAQPVGTDSNIRQASEPAGIYGNDTDVIITERDELIKERDDLKSKLAGTESLLSLTEYKVDIMRSRLDDKDLIIELQKELIAKLEASVGKKVTGQP